MTGRARSRVFVVLNDGTRACGVSSWPRFLLRRLMARNSRGGGPPLHLFAVVDVEEVVIHPGQIAEFLVSAYEGPQPHRVSGVDDD